MADLIQVADLAQAPSAQSVDFMHLKAVGDNVDYKITVSDLSTSIKGLLGLGALAEEDSITLVGGNGLDSSGDPLVSQTLSLGTPSSITRISTNSVTASSHTHAIDPTMVFIRGGIIMFSGTFSGKNPIPTGSGSPDTSWQICDGTNGTPDLRDRFIVGSGGSYATGNVGGSADASHTHGGVVAGHSLTENQMPKHYHQMKGPNSGSIPQGTLTSLSVYGGGTPDDVGWVYGTYSTGGGATSNGLETGTGNGDEHNHSLSIYSKTIDNRPPYYALAFIMKL